MKENGNSLGFNAMMSQPNWLVKKLTVLNDNQESHMIPFNTTSMRRIIVLTHVHTHLNVHASIWHGLIHSQKWAFELSAFIMDVDIDITQVRRHCGILRVCWRLRHRSIFDLTLSCLEIRNPSIWSTVSFGKYSWTLNKTENRPNPHCDIRSVFQWVTI